MQEPQAVEDWDGRNRKRTAAVILTALRTEDDAIKDRSRMPNDERQVTKDWASTREDKINLRRLPSGVSQPSPSQEKRPPRRVKEAMERNRKPLYRKAEGR
jgi:hypothetical protein